MHNAQCCQPTGHYLIGRGRRNLRQVGLSLLHMGISGRFHDIALFILYRQPAVSEGFV